MKLRRRVLVALVIILCLVKCVNLERTLFEAKSLLTYKIHLQQRFVSLKHERHRSTNFTYTTLNTEVDRAWNELPSNPSHGMTLDMIRGATPCTASIKVKIIRFRKTRVRTVCLFKDKYDWSIFEKKMEIEIMQERLSPESLYTQVFPVSGFVVDEISSVVKGYIVDKYFYGSIKIFDRIRTYHLHFYVEPIENIVLYDAISLNATIGRNKGDNAILFEYISHRDYYGTLKPPEIITTSPVDPVIVAPTPPVTSAPEVPSTTIPELILTSPIPSPTTNIVSTSIATSSQRSKRILYHSTEAVLKTARTASIVPSISSTLPDSTTSSLKRRIPYHSTEAVPRLILTKPSHVPKRRIQYHSTEAVPKSTVSKAEATAKPGLIKGKQRSRKLRVKRNASPPTLPDPVVAITANHPKSTIVKLTDERLIFQDEDIANTIKFQTGMSTSDIFDLRLDQSLVCSLCIWIQPNFAEMFGFDGGLAYGVAEIVEIIKLANWYFRALDFNSDGLAENIGLQIKKLIVTDDFKINPTASQEQKAKSSPFYPLMNNRLKKRAIAAAPDLGHGSFDVGNYDVDPNLIFEVHDLQYLNEIDDSPNDAIKLDRPKSYEKNRFSRMIYSLSTKQAYNDISAALQKDQRFAGCCTVLGFLYHDMSPSLSVSTLRGACSSSNVGLISGALHSHKIGKFDVLRSVMHSLGHLFGSHHDRTANSNCKDNHFSNFINPFLLDPIPQMNVGLRPNSMKMSPCAKLDIALFLTSPNLSCLRVEQTSFCGNGWIDEGEDCDCGSPWQCHLENVQCCGESDSLLGCKRVDTTDYRTIKSKKCPRPLIW